MCTEPLYAIRLKTEYDKKYQRFGKRTPITVLRAVRDVGKDTSSLIYNRKVYDLLMISCGQCMQCRLQRVKQRAVMSICESLEHKENSFVTLTFGYPQTYRYYRHDKKLSHYISAKKAHFHEWSLEVETFQKFMKRLRFWYYNYQLAQHLLSLGRTDLVFNFNASHTYINHNKHPRPFSLLEYKKHIRIPKDEKEELLKDFKPQKIRCLHCGEYGAKRFRPHHHCILFGFQFPDLEPLWENNCKYYTSKILEKLWPFGIHRIGECTYNSCAYVSRYVTKKINGSNQDEYYNGRKPEYVTYSTKPVLGSNYFVKNYKEIVNTQELCVVADKKYICRMPKSYDNILEKIDKDLYNEMKEKRVSDCVADLEKLLSSKRSIYAKLDSNNKICLSVLNKLVRNYENGAENYDEYLKKAKAFGLNTKFFDSEFSENAWKWLSNKTFKDHKSHSSNKDILDNYYKFELARRRSINACYNIKHSDNTVFQNLCMFINMPNPFRVVKRGKMLPDVESNDFEEYIDEKGRSYRL